MASHAHPRLRYAFISVHIATGALLLTVGCSGPAGTRAAAVTGWSDPAVNVVSRPATGAGVTAVTGLRKDGTLETAVYDLKTGKRLWTRPATMPGRLSGMGVQPPAVAALAGRPVVAAVEPVQAGKWQAALVARDALTGAQRWTRPVDSSFGPARCGAQLCLSESTARTNAHLAVLDPATGRARWRMPGIAEVEWARADRAVFFRMARHPTLDARDLRTGKRLWSYPVEKAVGQGVNLSGGWAFGARGDTLIGYLAPYQAGSSGKDRTLSAFGFFGLRLADGRPVWVRKRLLRVYPSANPAIALITRAVDPHGGYGAFAQLDPGTGATTARVATEHAPKTPWWLAFPADLSKLAFLSQDKPGTAVDLRRRTAVPAKGLRTWSFCTVTPAELPIKDQRGFYPVAPLCAYDLETGRKVAQPGPPPVWYTGAVDGWRVWRDERGTLHAVNDTKGSAPGMYG